MDEWLAAAEESPYQQSVDAFCRSAEALIGHDSADRIGGISAPTLVTVGELDLVLPPRFSEALVERIPERAARRHPLSRPPTLPGVSGGLQPPPRRLLAVGRLTTTPKSSQAIREIAVETGGLRFAALEAGEPGRPLVLCLHGFPDSAWTWRHLLPQLGAHGLHAVAPFLRGYAPTELPTAGFGIAELADDVLALEEALRGAGRSVIVGHDWGAAVVYAALHRNAELWRCAIAASVPPAGGYSIDAISLTQLRRSWYSYPLPAPGPGRPRAARLPERSGPRRLALGRLVPRLRRRPGHPPGKGSAPAPGSPSRGDQLLPGRADRRAVSRRRPGGARIAPPTRSPAALPPRGPRRLHRARLRRARPSMVPTGNSHDRPRGRRPLRPARTAPGVQPPRGRVHRLRRRVSSLKEGLVKRRSSSGCDGRSEARTQGAPDSSAIGKATENAASGRAARPDGTAAFCQTLLIGAGHTQDVLAEKASTRLFEIGATG